MSIRTEADYDAALAEVERLWGAEEGTEVGDRLDLLIPLISAYENQHHAIGAPNLIDERHIGEIEGSC
jgi:HTH-type transcriptional regulator / antitoxin HigA